MTQNQKPRQQQPTAAQRAPKPSRRGRAGQAHAKPRNMKGTLKRLIRYFRPRRWQMLAALLLIVVQAVADVIGNGMLRPVINGIVNNEGPLVLVRNLAVMGVIFIVAILCAYFGNRLLVHVSEETTYTIRKEMFEKMQELPISYFDTHAHGDIMSTYTNDMANVSNALQETLSNVITSVLTFLGTLVMMLMLSPMLTVLVLGVLLVMLLVVNLVSRLSAKYFRQRQADMAGLNGYVEEMMGGQKVIKVFNREAAVQKDFEAQNETLRKSGTLANTFAIIMMPLMGSLSFIQYAVVAVGGAWMAISGAVPMDLGTLAAFLQYTRNFSRPIINVANQLNLMISALAGAERIFDLMDQEPEIDEGTIQAAVPGTACRDNSWLIPQENGELACVPISGNILFEDVSFGYLPEQTVLKDISLYAKPGQKIAFVGSTGAGKTTITNLLNRFYEIRSGRILFDGLDIRKIRKADLRHQLGMVLQDVHLFEGTIRENIRYGNLDATDEAVEEAARIANADSFIRHLPDGYDTYLTADGSNLSQGQRQLLSIARAAVADPTILVLDEATSSIDTRTERLIEKGMDKLMEQRTTFAIAHRLSTVRHANAIMVLEAGEIIERGDHDDLLEQGGQYYRLSCGVTELT